MVDMGHRDHLHQMEDGAVVVHPWCHTSKCSKEVAETGEEDLAAEAMIVVVVVIIVAVGEVTIDEDYPEEEKKEETVVGSVAEAMIAVVVVVAAVAMMGEEDGMIEGMVTTIVAVIEVETTEVEAEAVMGDDKKCILLRVNEF